MNRKVQKQTFILGGLLLLVLSMTACNISTIKTGPTQTDNETVEMGDVQTAVVDIDMGIGELTVIGGADDLAEAEFIYNIADWKPELSYTQNDGNGRLHIAQPEGNLEGIPNDDIENTWNLKFNNELPMVMDIDLGVGESSLDLRSLNLTSLNLDTGAGSTTVLMGGSPLQTADIQAGIGEMKLDLSDGWDANADIAIDAGVGELTVVFPKEVGVIINADLGIGDLKANGFQKQGDQYVNDAYGESEVTLSVDLNGGIGEVTLQLEE